MSLKIATRIANDSLFHRARVGAVIAKGERILSSGCNRLGYTKYIKRPYPESIHAEQAAILKLLRERRLNDLAGSTLFVSRIGRTGVLRLAKPCHVCNELIHAVGISKVVYTTNEGIDEYRT